MTGWNGRHFDSIQPLLNRNIQISGPCCTNKIYNSILNVQRKLAARKFWVSQLRLTGTGETLVVLYHNLPGKGCHETLGRSVAGACHGAHLGARNEEEVLRLFRIVVVHRPRDLVVGSNAEGHDLKLIQARSHGQHLQSQSSDQIISQQSNIESNYT